MNASLKFNASQSVVAQIAGLSDLPMAEIKSLWF